MKLILKFSSGVNYELLESSFFNQFCCETYRATRGKLPGAYSGFGTFQWTSAVQALCMVVVRAAIQAVEGKDVKVIAQLSPDLEGERGSAAASLDDAICKGTAWLFDMFGSDSNGGMVAKRLILRSNSGRKRPGPVALKLNTKLLSPSSIKISVGNVWANDAVQLRNLLVVLEQAWMTARVSTSSMSCTKFRGIAETSPGVPRKKAA